MGLGGPHRYFTTYQQDPYRTAQRFCLDFAGWNTGQTLKLSFRIVPLIAFCWVVGGFFLWGYGPWAMSFEDVECLGREINFPSTKIVILSASEGSLAEQA